ncbi:MAG: ROK family transcriptional regulator [Micromonosporaceae bacterium]|nr:ROK family transcriptional regulator [Micromonosporaceae bacterium]
MPDVDLRPHQRRVLAEIAGHEQISRSDLGRRLDLPKATLNTIVRDLVERGLVVHTDAVAAGGRGRPAGFLTLAGRPTGIGVLGWSFDALKVVIATPGGRVLAEHAHVVDKNELRIDTAAELLGTVAGQAGYHTTDLACVVLGVPAPYQRGVGAPARRDGFGFAPWLQTDPAAALAAATGIRALLENDANLGALGEYVFGAGRDRHSLIYVKLAEHSVGAGLVINGWLHRGVTGFAGEIAHLQIDDDGPLCACGGRGCLIHRIGPGLLDAAQHAYDQPLTYPRMLAMAADGDTGMARLLHDLGRSVGRPLADACTMLNPEVIVVDGAAGTAGRHIIAGIAEMIDRFAAPPAAAAVTVVPGEAQTDADILGAVALARHEIDLSEIVR